MKDTATTAASAVFLLNDLWLHWLPFAWQIVLGGLGGVVLALTAYNKWLDSKLKKKNLNASDIEEGSS